MSKSRGSGARNRDSPQSNGPFIFIVFYFGKEFDLYDGTSATVVVDGHFIDVAARSGPEMAAVVPLFKNLVKFLDKNFGNYSISRNI